MASLLAMLHCSYSQAKSYGLYEGWGSVSTNSLGSFPSAEISMVVMECLQFVGSWSH